MDALITIVAFGCLAGAAWGMLTVIGIYLETNYACNQWPSTRVEPEEGVIDNAE